MSAQYDFERLSPDHLTMLRDHSGISDEAIAARGYYTAKFAKDLADIGFGKRQQRLTPALVVPILSPVDLNTPSVYQIRPAHPRVTAKNKERKYEFPYGAKMWLDVNPVNKDKLGNPKEPLFITEGAKKVDSLTTYGACSLGVSGVWNWRGRNDADGLCTLGDWEAVPLNDRKVYIAFDSDVVSNSSVARALHRFLAFLRARKADVSVIYLPDTKDVKLGVDDYLVKGKTIGDLILLASDALPEIEEETHVQTLLRLADSADLFRTPDEQRCIRVNTHDHFEILMLGERGSSGRDWLLRRYQEEITALPSSSALSSVMEYLGAEAAVGPNEEIYTRAAWADDTLYIDLGDDTFRAIEVTADGYKVVAQPLVNFKRPKGIMPLPAPQPGGGMELLRSFLNVEPDSGDEILIWAWLLGTFMPDGAYPHLGLHGEQGAAKSSATRFLRSLVDPNIAIARNAPKDKEALLIAARNSYILALENLSGLPVWLSDALCCLSTGAAISARQLYTNTEESILVAKRPVILNGINEIATRGDLLDRIMTVTLPEIPEDKRKDEHTLNALFKEKHPLILGSLLDAVSTAIRKHPETHLVNKPRMADFAKWVVAGSESFGWNEKDFLNAYMKNKKEGVEIEIQASIVGNALLAYLDSGNPSTDVTKTELLKRLEYSATQEGKTSLPRNWPTTVQKFAGELKRLQPALRQIGWYMKDNPRDNAKRTVSFECRTTPENSPFQEANSGDKVGDKLLDLVTKNDTLSPTLSPNNPLDDKGVGETTYFSDKSDKILASLSVDKKNESEKDRKEGENRSTGKTLSFLSTCHQAQIPPGEKVSHETLKPVCPECRSGRWMKTNYGMFCEACGHRESLS